MTDYDEGTDLFAPARASGTARTRVDAAAKGQSVGRVNAGETWTFRARGLWKDWFIRCGPDGYRSFPFYLISAFPEARDQPWFCLMGKLSCDGGGEEVFPIGKDLTRRFDAGGVLFVEANDMEGRRGNNSGSVELEIAAGGVATSPASPRPGFFPALARVHRGVRGIPVAAGLVALVGLVLAMSTPGRDLLRTPAEDDWSAAWPQLVFFGAALVFLAVQAWFWTRAVIDYNCGADREAWRPRWFFTWLPRVVGCAPFAAVVAALWLGGVDDAFFFVIIALGLGFLVFLMIRVETMNRIRSARRRKGEREGRTKPPLPLVRYWTLLTVVLAAGLTLAAIAWPVGLGRALGAPAVVFLAVGLIIPVAVTVAQLRTAEGVPWGMALLISLLVAGAFADNHEVRTLPAADGAAPPARMTLAEAYQAWKTAQPPGEPLVMTLVAAQGGASRTGLWTAEVLGALHAATGGRFATSLFAINSVSGGSLGAVSYAALLADTPDGTPESARKRLSQFAGADGLGPLLTSMLFPDLMQRFVPVAVLPDRASALEKAWEAAWSDSCAADAVSGCNPDFLAGPFLALRGGKEGPWRPIVIVQGASQETGRRILTSTVRFAPTEINADDFFELTGADVPISTAIHNGARFPWISPTGTMVKVGADGAETRIGHIVDGGYFDAAGVETIRELARAVERIAKEDDLSFVFVLIGYKGLLKVEPEARQPRRLFNEVIAPLHAMVQSRPGHGDHLMRELKLHSAEGDLAQEDPYVASVASSQEEDDRADYVPVMLCDGADFEVPMNWALSDLARRHIADAVSGGCSCSPELCPEQAIAEIGRLIAPATVAAAR